MRQTQEQSHQTPAGSSRLRPLNIGSFSRCKAELGSEGEGKQVCRYPRAQPWQGGHGGSAQGYWPENLPNKAGGWGRELVGQASASLHPIPADERAMKGLGCNQAAYT